MSDIDYSVVLDDHERATMLAEGYLPEVIDWEARQRYSKALEDYNWKNAILKQKYRPVPFFEFVGDVFPGLDKLMVVTAERGYREMDVDELMEYQADRSDVYVVPASFINGYNSTVACKDVYALVVDIDNIKPEDLEAIINNGNLGHLTPMPTHIVNSGRGVHFYYVFADPVPHYFVNRKILKEMYRQLCLTTKRNIAAKTDWHAITQPFRLPGSLTRLDQVVTGWRCAGKWDVRALAHWLGVDCKDLDLQRRILLPQREYQEIRQKRQEHQAEVPVESKKCKKSTWKSSLEGNEGFYRSCLERCFNDTREGFRYRSMCALVVVARKVVTISKIQVEQDLIRLLAHYNKIGRRMKHSEIKKALRMYNDKALETKSTTLEAWFGWTFNRDAARRRAMLEEKGRYVKRSRKEILERARKIQEIDYPEGSWRNKDGPPTKKHVVLSWREQHPEGTPKECISDTGLSKNTVYKWWKAMPATPAALPVIENGIEISRTKHDALTPAIDKIPEWIVKEVEARSDYTLLITFSRGEKKLYNARSLLQKKIYVDLKDPEFFLKARVECGTVVWNDAVDLDPEHLYEMSVPVEFEK